jgi:hypothetical protein
MKENYMNKSNAINFIFSVTFFTISCNVSAGVDVKNFEFKGHKFGDNSLIQENLPSATFLKTLVSKDSSLYPRVSEAKEANADVLMFGDYKLTGIVYSHFDKKLYKIAVDFLKQSDCNHAREANELIQLKYGLKTEVSKQLKSGDYISKFSNGKVLVFINCSSSILDTISNIQTTEKETQIVFEDVVRAKRVLDYMKQENDASFKKSQKVKEDKVREKINF